MTSADDYIGEVWRAMSGMDRSVRKDILRELKGHIAESAAANGGNVSAALSALGSPREVGRHYRDVYGYGRRYRLLFTIVAVVLAILSVPVLIVGTENLFPFALSIVFLIGAAAWILWVSVAAGSRTGLVAGLSALVARSGAFAVAAVLQEGGIVSVSGLGFFIAASALLVLLGWIPGTARKAWSGPRPEL